MFPKEIKVAQLNEISKGCMVEHVGIELTEIGSDFLIGKMPVDHRTHQPMGLLHGGASVVLAETLGSIASTLLLDMKKQYAVGLEINANHIKSARSGYVTGKCMPIHIGKGTHVWQIEIKNEEGQLVCISRLTLAILSHSK
ncbi:MAG: hotdog fold thioesterase [Cyclobacteriaceae bacterium]|nr:hotdog fold thioesterase [Cyclobacteriaceae bacterium]